MTAGISFIGGRAEMAYIETDGIPWWGGGQPQKSDATPEEWAEACGFDKWCIESAPVQFVGKDGAVHEMTDRKVLYRNDNFDGLSVVSTDYNITQPMDTLAYMRRCCERGGFQMRTAGALFGGRQFWAQASIQAEAYILDPMDKVRRNLLMCSSADYSLANTVKFVDETVVCRNTLSVALGERTKQFKQSHKAVLNFDDIDEKLGITAREQFEGEVEKLRKLAQTPLSQPELVRVALEVYEPKSAELEEVALIKMVARSRPIRRIMELSISDDLIGFDMKGKKGTAWGGLNVFTQYIDHDGGARTVDRRWQKALFTTGDKVKTRAHNLLVQHADGEVLPKCALTNNTIYELVMSSS
jgi:phage/plasmid-like protein (TIGR03299 family)